jgi:dihydrodipicolinate synthase/N-acetylneuraminate lyase
MDARSFLAAQDIEGIVAIMPTPVVDGADPWDSREVVNSDEAARGADSLVTDGIDCLPINGTSGEAATLMWDELQAFSETDIEAIAGGSRCFSAPPPSIPATPAPIL